jgi:L-ascorbate metabolism protein UlaG (beta-lactamase superfamily)
MAKTECDIVTISHDHQDHSCLDKIAGDPLILNMPGEYEKGGIRVTGFESYHDKKRGEERGRNIIYRVEMEDLIIVHCGDLGHLLSKDLQEEIGDVNVLMIPVGGVYTIDAEEAVKIVNEMQPDIVIPMHYKQDKLDSKTFGGLLEVSAFVSAMGVDPVIKGEKKVKISSADIGEDTKIIVMKRE